MTLTYPADAMSQVFRARPANSLPEVPRYNICPTQHVAVVTSGDMRDLRTMRWGLVPGWYKTPTDGPLIINARAETIAAKPAFRQAVRERRCILPVSGFYEWSAGPKGERLPWYITRTDGALMAFAAVWQHWEREGVGFDSCAIVTAAAGPGLERIHHREPVILEPDDWPLWLGEAGHGAAPLMKATAPGVLQSWRVDTVVNSNRAIGPELIEPLSV